jgi:DNA (cytosine-5)-methyltransferase 1
MNLAWYNERDPFCAAWLVELIKEGVIADGVVDDRDIQDIAPSELEGYSQWHMFAGTGAWSYALRSAGWDDARPVLTVSCPCTPFSAAGKGAGVADERHLWPAAFHIIEHLRPACVFGEQVVAAVKHGWWDLVAGDLEAIGYSCWASAFPAASVGAWHKRERLYFASWLDNSIGIGTQRPGTGEQIADAGRTDVQLGEPNCSGSQSRRPTTESNGYGYPAQSASGDGNMGYPSIGAHDRQPGSCNGSSIAAGGSGIIGNRLVDATGRGENAAQLPGQRSEPEQASVMGDSTLGGFGMRGEPSRDSRWATQPSESDSVGDPSPSRLPDMQPENLPGSRRGSQRRAATEPGTVINPSPWSDIVWIYCRDGKYRPIQRTTEPALERVADGTADHLGLTCIESAGGDEEGIAWVFAPLIQKGKARVGRLKGYGNAIVSYQAQVFIEAFMEACEEITSADHLHSPGIDAINISNGHPPDRR